MSWGSKTPQDILLPPHLAQAQAVGVDVPHLAQFPAPYQFQQARDPRGDTPTHGPTIRDAPLAFGQTHQLSPLLVGQRQWLLA